MFEEFKLNDIHTYGKYFTKYFINYTATSVNASFPDVKLYKNTLNVM